MRSLGGCSVVGVSEDAPERIGRGKLKKEQKCLVDRKKVQSPVATASGMWGPELRGNSGSIPSKSGKPWAQVRCPAKV